MTVLKSDDKIKNETNKDTNNHHHKEIKEKKRNDSQ